MNLKITDYGAIESADVNIKRINLVGGINNSGKSTASKLLYCYLKSKLSNQPLGQLIESEGLKNPKFVEFEADTDISEIFYIETISPVDLKNQDFLNVDHIRHLTEALSKKSNTNQEILEKIISIIQNDCSNLSSAGIKQIGLILMLVQNGSIKENSFLIIDEPESNLHPSWQIRFADMLVLLAKDLNVTLYMNSHSPIFIEAVSLYSQYYRLLDETSFYLTQKTSQNYTFKQIDPKNMGEVYENLTSPYDELDRLKARILFRE